MSEPRTETPRFNVLTDPWLPLIGADGATVWASPVEVLCGERDGVDLDYPRDDFRIFGRLLLSALIQALFPAETNAQLSQRIDKPLRRAEVEARIHPVLTEFDLFGATPFLQVTPPTDPPEKGAAPFVFPGEDLFRTGREIDAISLEVATVMLFIEQTYAGGAGRGYGAGPAGQLGALTLVDPGTVRGAAWANTLTLETAAQRYAKDGQRPWSNAKRDPRPRAATGIVEGLFFQSRSIWLIPVPDGECSFSGRSGRRVRRSPLLPKSELTKKRPGAEDLWQHPCAPLAVNSQGIGAVRLNPQRPAWTGLAQLLDPIANAKAKKNHPSAGPAPVLQQWKNLAGKRLRPRLLVLDFDRDKANVKGRFFEAFSLTDRFVGDRDSIDRLRALTSDAQIVEAALKKALLRAHDDRKLGGLALADAERTFWTASEAPFLDWLSVATSVDETEAEAQVDERIEHARQTMHAALRSTAMKIFDAHVSMSEFDPRKQERVAKARRGLRQALYQGTLTTPRAPTSEVTP